MSVEGAVARPVEVAGRRHARTGALEEQVEARAVEADEVFVVGGQSGQVDRGVERQHQVARRIVDRHRVHPGSAGNARDQAVELEAVARPVEAHDVRGADDQPAAQVHAGLEREEPLPVGEQATERGWVGNAGEDCALWTSSSSSETGAMVRLLGNSDPAERISPLSMFSLTCDSTIGVWCVQD